MKIREITQYRSVWMGVAILWVVLLHSGLKDMPILISVVRELGYGGVDIFCFCSGIGLYCSYTKDHNILRFFRRRIQRILPPYIMFITVWVIFKIAVSSFPWISVLGNILGVEGLAGRNGEFNWYITYIVISYSIAPIVASVVEGTADKFKALLLVLCVLIISLVFWETESIMLVTRLPIFTVGMLCGKLITLDYTLSKREVALVMLGFALGLIACAISFIFGSKYLWTCGLYWYPFILITPGMCLVLAEVMRWLSQSKPGAMLCFEIYLVHIFLFDIAKFLEEKSYIVVTNGTICFVALSTYPIALALFRCSQIMGKRLMKGYTS